MTVAPIRTTGWRPVADLDAEGVVLSAVLLDPVRYDEVAGILRSAEAFYSDANRNIWRAMEALASDSRPVDVVTVAAWLNEQNRLQQVGGTPYLAQITDSIPAVAHVAEHARIVYEKWRLRQAMAIAQTIDASIKGGDPVIASDPQAFLEEIEKRFALLAQQNSQEALVSIHDVLVLLHAKVEANYQRGGAVNGTPMGFRDLDKDLSGLQPGDLYIVAGRPGMGKTAFVLSLALNIVKAGDGVAMFSLEMPSEQVGMRILSIDSGIPFTKIRSAAFLTDQDWVLIGNSMNDLDKVPFWVDDTAAITLSALRARVRKLKADIAADRSSPPCKKLVAVVVDYLQLMGSFGQSREQEVSALSRGLKALAKEESVAVIALSQLNRKSTSREDKRPELSDLRESGAIEQDSDTVLFVHREEYYDDKNEEVAGTAEIKIAKQRNGPVGVRKVAFRKETMRFLPLATDDFDEYAADN